MYIYIYIYIYVTYEPGVAWYMISSCPKLVTTCATEAPNWRQGAGPAVLRSAAAGGTR